MGIERKNPKLNWIGSFGLIILAGTLYRVSRVQKKFLQTEVASILSKLGSNLPFQSKKPFQKVFPSEYKRSDEELARNRQQIKQLRSIRLINKVREWL